MIAGPLKAVEGSLPPTVGTPPLSGEACVDGGCDIGPPFTLGAPICCPGPFPAAAFESLGMLVPFAVLEEFVVVLLLG